jgi:hypothetical protein
MTTEHDGYPMTGRNPVVLADLIDTTGNSIWQGIDSGGDADRGDRNLRPDLIAKHDSRRNRKD